MAEYLSGQISFGGLTENTDFETLREKLKAIELRKANQLARWKSDWQTRIDAFQQVRTAMVTLQSKLNSMNSVSKFLVKSAESSQPSVAKATAGQASSPGVYTLEVNQLASAAIWTNEISNADKTTVVNTSGTTGIFKYDYAGKTRELYIPDGTTLEGLKKIINHDSQNPGVVAQLVSIPGNKMLFQIRGKETGATIALNVDLPTDLIAELDPAAWTSQLGQDAQIRYNGWPSGSWLSVPSNTLTDLLDTGLTVNLYDTGSTTITVEVDSAAVRKNVEEFVDAMNAFRTTIMDLTKYDANKTVYQPEYANSQSEMQKGSVLTGNYGIQMIASKLKSIVASQALGFSYRDAAGQGDLFSSLSQIGIMTNTDQGSAMYGLLEINLISDNEAMPGAMNFEEALSRDPEGVALLFAARGEGYSTAPSDFGHVSHIEGMTKPGLYDVEYTVDDFGVASGTINGKPFVLSAGNQAGIYDSSPPSNAADGLVIELYDLTPTSISGKPVTGSVGVRQGKVNELLATMDGSQGFLGAEGTLAVLENNYKGIIKNIDEKLVKEDERLIKWERTIKARFSRLEAQIARYQELQSSLKSQIAQLGQKSS
jgi:flagellar hook-associated protein 2